MTFLRRSLGILGTRTATVCVFIIVFLGFHFIPEVRRPSQDNLDNTAPPTPGASLLSSLDESLDQEDPYLIQTVKDKFLELPPPPGPLKLTMVTGVDHPMLQGQFGQAAKVVEILGGMKGGFFLECGAADGETLSNTLLLEMKYNWTGLLIEANPSTYRGIRERHRNVYSLNVCLSPSSHPQSLKFTVVEDNLRSKLGEVAVGNVTVTQCLPLYTVLLAIGNPTVHYLSLDVEGVEHSVLSSVPWDKVDIKVLTVETSHSSRPAIKELMMKAGYRVHADLGEDLLLVKEGFKVLAGG